MKRKFEELSDTQKDLLKIAIALGVLAIFIGVTLYNNYRNAVDEFEASHERTIVKDNSRYFTVLGCAKKYLNYVKQGNSEDILLILNEEYKNTFNITSQNLNNHIPSLEKSGLYDYVGEEMYEKKISKNVTEYYVYGQIQKSMMDEPNTYVDYNLTVILYEDRLLYSIRPGVSES